MSLAVLFKSAAKRKAKQQMKLLVSLRSQVASSMWGIETDVEQSCTETINLDVPVHEAIGDVAVMNAHQ